MGRGRPVGPALLRSGRGSRERSAGRFLHSPGFFESFSRAVRGLRKFPGGRRFFHGPGFFGRFSRGDRFIFERAPSASGNGRAHSNALQRRL